MKWEKALYFKGSFFMIYLRQTLQLIGKFVKNTFCGTYFNRRR